MNLYMGYPRDGRHECAVLIFANRAREAKAISYNTVMDFGGCEYIDVYINKIESAPHLIEAADQQKLKDGIAHVIDSPPSCQACCLWGPEFPINNTGKCPDCTDRDIDYAKWAIEKENQNDK